jgi:hypothetical protein
MSPITHYIMITYHILKIRSGNSVKDMLIAQEVHPNILTTNEKCQDST